MQCGRDIIYQVMPGDITDCIDTEVNVSIKVNLRGIATIRDSSDNIIGFVCSKMCGDMIVGKCQYAANHEAVFQCRKEFGENSGDYPI